MSFLKPVQSLKTITSIYAKGTALDKTPAWEITRDEPKPYVTSAKWLMAPRVHPSRDNTTIPTGFKVTMCKAVKPAPSPSAK